MALINRRLGLILTAAPGTGSTSLLDVFGRLPGSEQVPKSDRIVDGVTVLDAKHATVGELEAAGVHEASDRRGLRIVTSTRNPFDFWPAEWWRTRTRWADLQRDPSSWVHRQDGMLRRIADAVELPFRTWLERALGEHARAGHRMHLNEGHVVEADVVLRMEHIDDDLRGVVASSELDGMRVPHLNQTGGHRPYEQWYDDATRSLVAAVYEPDIRRFGYHFGDG